MTAKKKDGDGDDDDEGEFDLSKLPDVYDAIKYDMLHTKLDIHHLGHDGRDL